MVFCFFSEYNCALKVDGKFFGVIKTQTVFADIPKNSFVEIYPLDNSSESFFFFTDEEFLSSPYRNVCVTDLKGGYLIYLLKTAKSPFSVIYQEKFKNAMLTAFSDNGYKLSIETPYDFYVEEVSGKISSLSATPLKANGNLIEIELLCDKKQLFIFDVSNKITKVFSSVINEYSFDGELSTTHYYKDIAKHKVVIKRIYKNGSFLETERKTERSDKFDFNALPDKIKPFAFFEELSVKGNCMDFVSENVKENYSLLCDYVGEFIGVMPPPYFRKENEIGLIRKIKENVYSVDYYSAEIDGGKIFNVKKSD